MDERAPHSAPHLQRSLVELEAGLDAVRTAPTAEGALALLVRRPSAGAREVLESGELSLSEGLVGDEWCRRFSRHTPDGSPHPDMQLTLMNVRAVALVAGPRERWALAGDQLFVEFDLSAANAPPGTRLAIGDAAVVEVTSKPHRGCAKFSERFGLDALRLISSRVGVELNLRGVNAKVVAPGTVRPGDVLRKQARA